MENIIKKLVELSKEIIEYVTSNEIQDRGHWQDYFNKSGALVFAVYQATEDPGTSAVEFKDKNGKGISLYDYSDRIEMPYNSTNESLSEVYKRSFVEFNNMKQEYIVDTEEAKAQKKAEKIQSLKAQLFELESETLNAE